MDIEKHLILVKNEDKTGKIDSCKYTDSKWRIRYHNNSRIYDYSDQNVVWYKDPKYIDEKTSIVYENSQPISDIIKVLDFGPFVRLMFKTGYQKLYPSSTLVIEETCLKNPNAQSIFEYLKTLSDHVSVKVDGKQSLLSKQYSELVAISPRSVLSAYLEGKPLSRDDMQPQVIFPFGFNLSQKSATEKAMTEQVSIIEGPPGTGKTQTILNIISNAVLNGKTVAVVSNNNSATANVVEKLEKYGVGFIAGFLGSKKNREKFFAEQKNTYPNMSNWELEESDFQSIGNGLKESQRTLNEMLAHKNRQAVLKQELSTLKIEFEYFNKYYTESRFEQFRMNSFSRFNADKVLKILLKYKRMAEQGTITLKNKLYNFFAYGIYNFKIYKFPPEVVISYLQKTYYHSKIDELQIRIDELEKKLENYNFENVMEKYSSDSMMLFKAELAGKYGPGGSRKVFISEDLWKNFDAFINEYPVILSTTHSLRNSAAKNYLFDYVLIDEASQVDLVTGALALSCARNAVIVGDLKQLPNVVPSEVASATTKIFDSFNLDQAYNFVDHSLLSSIKNLYKENHGDGSAASFVSQNEGSSRSFFKCLLYRVQFSSLLGHVLETSNTDFLQCKSFDDIESMIIYHSL